MTGRLSQAHLGVVDVLVRRVLHNDVPPGRCGGVRQMWKGKLAIIQVHRAPPV